MHHSNIVFAAALALAIGCSGEIAGDSNGSTDPVNEPEAGECASNEDLRENLERQYCAPRCEEGLCGSADLRCARGWCLLTDAPAEPRPEDACEGSCGEVESCGSHSATYLDTDNYDIAEDAPCQYNWGGCDGTSYLGGGMRRSIVCFRQTSGMHMCECQNDGVVFRLFETPSAECVAGFPKEAGLIEECGWGR